MANKKKPMFHAPQKTGKVVPVPMNPFMWTVSILSLVLLAALTAFAIYAASTRGGETIILSQGFTMNAGLLFLFLPIVGWILAAGFRLAIRLIPLEMWRLPMSIREATIKTKGKYLKMATLLIELETVISFGYITWCLYNGTAPGNIPIIVWVAAVVATIIYFGRYVKIAAERV